MCDDVVQDTASGKISLLNLWDTVRVEDGFPYCLKKICLFAWWRGGLGQLMTRIDIVQGSTGDVIRRTEDFVLEFVDRTQTMFAKYTVENCLFPAPGCYFIELYGNQEFVDDQSIRVMIR